MSSNEIKLSTTNKLKYKSLFERHPSLIDSVAKETAIRSSELNERLSKHSPWLKDQNILSEVEERSNQLDLPSFKGDYQNYAGFMKRAQSPVASKFWKSELENLSNNSSDMDISHQLLMQKWKQQMECSIVDWENQETQQLQKEFDSKLDSNLSQFEELCSSAGESGMDLGQFFDCSQEEMDESSFQEMKKWVEAISQNEQTQKICELMGQACQPHQSATENQRCSTQNSEKYRYDNIKEEIVGITFSKDISTVLPSELALLGDPETEALFDLKYIESRLMSYDKSSNQNSLIESDEECDAEVKDERGPIILCIDTSGSMGGTPEDIAKAVALYMTTLAKQEKRNCYLMSNDN